MIVWVASVEHCHRLHYLLKNLEMMATVVVVVAVAVSGMSLSLTIVNDCLV